MDENGKPKAMGQVIQIDEARIRDHLGEMVRGTVEEALNAMLDAEADRLCGAGRYERSEGRKDTRAGSYERSLDTKGPIGRFLRRTTLRKNFQRTQSGSPVSGWPDVQWSRNFAVCGSRMPIEVAG